MGKELTAGKFLKMVRQNRGDLVQDVAIRYCCSGTYISGFESDNRKISGKVVYSIALAYCLTEQEVEKLINLTQGN